jgi:hypothetical protein
VRHTSALAVTHGNTKSQIPSLDMPLIDGAKRALASDKPVADNKAKDDDVDGGDVVHVCCFCVC